MQQPISGMSQPSVSTMQLVTSSISPEASRARMASRSSVRRPAVDVLGDARRRDELVADVDAVLDADGEADGLPALAELVPMGDDVADQLGRVHALGELALDIVAARRFGRRSGPDRSARRRAS